MMTTRDIQRIADCIRDAIEFEQQAVNKGRHYANQKSVNTLKQLALDMSLELLDGYSVYDNMTREQKAFVMACGAL